MSDPVDHPPHYTAHPSGIECIQITEHMSFCLGNAIKYLWRADKKGATVEDMRKAIWYIEREIALRAQTAKRDYPYDGVPFWWNPSWPTLTFTKTAKCRRPGCPLDDSVHAHWEDLR